MEKKIILLIVALMTAIMTFADTYKVLYVNSKSVRVNGKIATVGLVFSDKDNIAWADDNQAMKVLNLSTKHVVILAAKSLKMKNAASIYDYLTSKKHLSTRNFISTKPLEVWQIDSTLYLLDTIYISRPQYGSNNVVAQVIDKEGDVVNIPISEDGNYFIITDDIYN